MIVSAVIGQPHSPLRGADNLLGQPRDLRPTLHERIVAKGLLGTVLLVADAIEAVGQLASGLSIRAKLAHQQGGGVLSFLVMHADQMVHSLPYDESGVTVRDPVFGQLMRPEQADFARTGTQYARLHHTRNAGVLGRRQRLRYAVIAFSEPRLLEPRQCPSGIGVEVALLLSEHLVKGLVDEGEGFAH